MAASPIISSPDFVRSSLSRRERELLRSIGEAMFSEDGEVSPARLDATVHDADAYVSATSVLLRGGLRLLLFVLWISPLLLFVSTKTIDRLPLAARVTTLTRLERLGFAPLSLAFVAWRAILTLVFYEDAGELAQIGYGEARHRHKRRLALATVPPMAESGVRLRDHEGAADRDDDDDSDDARQGAA